jgi:hypothetical protein
MNGSDDLGESKKQKEKLLKKKRLENKEKSRSRRSHWEKEKRTGHSG